MDYVAYVLQKTFQRQVGKGESIQEETGRSQIEQEFARTNAVYMKSYST